MSHCVVEAELFDSIRESRHRAQGLIVLLSSLRKTVCIVFVVVLRPVEVRLDTFLSLRLLLQAMPILAQQICAVLVFEFV